MELPPLAPETVVVETHTSTGMVPVCPLKATCYGAFDYHQMHLITIKCTEVAYKGHTITSQTNFNSTVKRLNNNTQINSFYTIISCQLKYVDMRWLAKVDFILDIRKAVMMINDLKSKPDTPVRFHSHVPELLWNVIHTTSNHEL